MKKIEHYRMRDSQAGFRNKMSNMVDYILRGKEAAEKAVMDERNEDNTRQFLKAYRITQRYYSRKYGRYESK